MASSPDNAGTGQHCQMVWVRQARQDGVREKPVLNAPQSSLQLEPDGSGLVSDAHPPRLWWGTLEPILVVGAEATMNACGVVVAMSQGHSWAPPLSNGSQ